MQANSDSSKNINIKNVKKGILPKNIKYYDDLLDKEFILHDHADKDLWVLNFNATSKKLRFFKVHEEIKPYFKSYLAELLLKQKPESVFSVYSSVKRFLASSNDLQGLINYSVSEIKNKYQLWLNNASGAKNYARKIVNFLAYLAKNNFGKMNSDQLAQIKSWSSPKIIKNLRAINGSYKLNFYEELKVSQYLESKIEFYKSIVSLEKYTCQLLSDVTLAFCMSFGLRTKQLAMLKIGSIQEFGSEIKYLDIAIPIIKQKNNKREFFRKALPSKWQFLISLWWDYKRSVISPEKYFNTPLLSGDLEIKSPLFYTNLIKDITSTILIEPKTPYHFRHTFAQRMADSGASAAEISVALTQTTTESAQAYVGATSNMAKIISEALGRSEVYRNLPDIFTGRFIIKKDLDHAHQDKKIIGIVDGVLMPGIGVCSTSVNLCERSPLLACHTCPKFMPVMELEPHLKLAEQLRELVFRFKSVEEDINMPSSPLKKLGDTLAVIEKLIQEIRFQAEKVKNQ